MKKNKYLTILSLGLFLVTPGAIKVDAQPPLKTAEAPVVQSVTVKVWVTAYSSTPEETDDTPFITASGKRVRDGIAAANFLPFGTRIQIPELFGDKTFVIEDRMSKRKSNFVDIWMPTKNKAKFFGINEAEVVILDLKNQKSIPNNILALK
ncbi:MAG: hypothetical protein UY23_C0006G0038 [Candidatus Jorgensenbacteria bacterium GW2011_GWA1_48_11]|uniref:3D domain-containing protein n=1 Tax=Candidatus Jorgensenbacteria bacterium GW2011_GWA1_48_11 TaxID=1618660 RepID=A0A0G1U9R2_9BACT|nr:MAG: hypothetical protein UY23_C0006G0038 [Candidatus Jorgensenbacteria bacterium GW2011_GWA1_48_11]KKW12394.1 MAG: hypothetical protein UY51_C0005G0636 [Candidatus Jorgensenbacteria bacterium GW2011_GWB1_49_9]